MNKEDYIKYLEILEIDGEASLDEIEKAYLHLRELYSSDTMITFPLDDELDESKKKEIICQVKDAYVKLKRFIVEKGKKAIEIDLEKAEVKEIEKSEAEAVEEEKETGKEDVDEKEEKKELTVSMDEDSKIEAEESPAYDGKTLKQIRENLKVKLDEVSREIEVPHKMLKNIENEKFDNLPQGGYLRWHIVKYATYLSINPQKAADDYMKCFREWEKDKKAGKKK